MRDQKVWTDSPLYSSANCEVCEKCGAKQLQAESESIKQKACPREDEG